MKSVDAQKRKLSVDLNVDATQNCATTDRWAKIKVLGLE